MEGLADELDKQNNDYPKNGSFLSSLTQKHLSSKQDDPFPRDLLEFSLRAEKLKTTKTNLYPSHTSFTKDRLNHYYASPDIALNHRDLAALADLFKGDDIEEIVNNITDILVSFSPVLCWEDDPLDFLTEYL